MRLLHQILLATLLTTLPVIGLVGITMYSSVRRGVWHYIHQIEVQRVTPAVERLAQEHHQRGDWEFLRGEDLLWSHLLRPADPPGVSHPPPPLRREPPAPLPMDELRPAPPYPAAPPARFGPAGVDPRIAQRRPPADSLDLERRLTLYDAARRPVYGAGRFAEETTSLPIYDGAVLVGWLGLRPLNSLRPELDERYWIDREARSAAVIDQSAAFAVIAAVAVGVALGISFLLTRRLLQPVHDLAQGARQLASGNYQIRLSPRGRDELGLLLRDFNSLALTLQQSEQSRRRWVADVSHELRTPLTILRAEVEALRDGVRAVDDTTLESLHSEILRLGKLVDDLHQLARADLGDLQYHKQPLDPLRLLREVLQGFQARLAERRLAVQDELPRAPAAQIHGDPARLKQLFVNLLENSCRYTDPGGTLRLRATCDPRELCIELDDTAPGVAAADLPRLLGRERRSGSAVAGRERRSGSAVDNHLLRAERARPRDGGGSGLGLAIAQRIVQAHEGHIRVAPSALGGLAVQVRLPLA